MTLYRNFTDFDGNTTHGAIVEVHKYNGNKAKMMFELDYDFAVELTETVVKAGGHKRVLISVVDENGNAEPIDARIDSIDPRTRKQLNRQGQPGVCTFAGITFK
ncbi:MAG: hypothetical protein GQ539_08745 [Sulfitobacter sp.]|nr:hypothetical protein [Sulfitobacter sp.]